MKVPRRVYRRFLWERLGLWVTYMPVTFVRAFSSWHVGGDPEDRAFLGTSPFGAHRQPPKGTKEMAGM